MLPEVDVRSLGGVDRLTCFTTLHMSANGPIGLNNVAWHVDADLLSDSPRANRTRAHPRRQRAAISPAVDGVVTRLRATLAEVQRAGHEVLVIAPRQPGMHVAGVRVVGVPTIGFRFVYGGKRWGLPSSQVARHLRGFAPDVVHVLNPVLVGSAGVLAAWWQCRTLVASHHTDLAHYAAHYHLGWTVPLLRALQRRLHGAAHLNLATSTTAARELAAHGIAHAAVWPRGVDLDQFHPARRPVSTRRCPVALYVGRLAAEKGLHRLAPLAHSDSAIQLTLVGTGPAEAELHHQFGHTATFTGPLYGRELAAVYRHADVFVFPSTTDTLGLVLLEALASGLPIVAVDCPTNRETLADCPAARIIPAEQPDQLPIAITELLHSAPRSNLAEQARQHAQQWNWRTATDQLLTYYHRTHIGPESTDSPRQHPVKPA